MLTRFDQPCAARRRASSLLQLLINLFLLALASSSGLGVEASPGEIQYVRLVRLNNY